MFTNILTVDFEDWYHICGVEKELPIDKWDGFESKLERGLEILLSILEEKGSYATFFVLGYCAKRFPELVRRILQRGHEIAYHSWYHNLLYKITPDTFERDIEKAIHFFQKKFGIHLSGFRAPQWSIKANSLIWAHKILISYGFKYDSSLAPLAIIGKTSLPTYPFKIKTDTGEIIEYPPLVGGIKSIHLPLGGGWGLRTFPYLWIKNNITKLNQRGYPAIIHIHPWELTSPHPEIKRLPVIKRLVVKGGFVPTKKRLKRLLTDFKFTSIERWMRSPLRLKTINLRDIF